MAPDVMLDAGQSGCGELSLLIFKAMRALAPGQTLEVHAYDLAAGMDIPAWCRSTGNRLEYADTSVHPQRFVIRKHDPEGDYVSVKTAD